MTEEALKLALEALEGVLDDAPKVLDASISGGLYEVVQCREAITAIKEALAQHDSVQAKPEPEQDHIPDARKMVTEQEPDIYPEEAYEMGLEAIAYYTTPPQRTWVGLTDEEIEEIGFESADRESAVIQTIDKLKERNT